MAQRLAMRVRKRVSVFLALVLIAGAVLLARPAPALAHCDDVNGPVVSAAKEALEKGKVELVLPYVKAGAEKELTGAFEHTLKVRGLGGEAKALADSYFFETVVRLHRAGEGAAYTGLKYNADFGPALEAAEMALEKNSVKDVSKLLEQALREGVSKRFKVVLEAREAAKKVNTVEAQRERAEAELLFEQYVYGVYNMIAGETVHSEGEAAAAHSPAEVGH